MNYYEREGLKVIARGARKRIKSGEKPLTRKEQISILFIRSPLWDLLNKTSKAVE